MYATEKQLKKKNYGTLYVLLKNLLINKVNINNVNIDQIHLISNLMQGHNKNYLFDEKIKALNKARTIFYNRKQNKKKVIKNFIPEKLLKRHFRRPQKYFNKCKASIKW